MRLLIAVLAVAALAAADLNAGMVNRWALDGNLDDAVGSKPLTYYAGPGRVFTYETGHEPTNPSQSLKLPGMSGQEDFGAKDLVDFNGDWSLSIWYKPTQRINYWGFLYSVGGGYQGHTCYLRDNEWNWVEIVTNNGFSGVSAITPRADGWMHMCAVNGPSFLWYYNGGFSGVGTFGRVHGASSRELFLGSHAANPVWTGAIGLTDEIRLYNRAISHQECMDLFLLPNPAGTPCYTPEALKAQWPATLIVVPGETGFKSLDMMNLIVNAPRVFTRSAITFSLGTCVLDGAKYYFDTCNDRYLIVKNWADLVQCGMVKTLATEEKETYKGILVARYSEEAGKVHNVPITRDILSEMPFEVIFNKVVVATTMNEHKVYANASIGAVLSNVTVSVQPDKSIGLDLVVGVQLPFQLTFKSLELDGGYGSAVIVADPIKTITDPANTHRIQVWRSKVSPVAGICVFDHVPMVAKFTAYCDNSVLPVNCPFPNAEPVNIELVITTSDMCAQVVDEVSVTASQTAYADAAYTQVAQAFFIGRTVYLGVTITSPKVTLSDSYVKKIVCSGGAVIGGSATIATGDYTTDYKSATSPNYYLVLSGKYFQVPEESFGTLTITTTFIVKYQGNVRADVEKEVTLSTSVAAANAGTSAASHLAPWF